MEDASLGACPIVVFHAANSGGVDAADHMDVVAGGVGAAVCDAKFRDLQVERPAE
jgi:hypothetical protein